MKTIEAIDLIEDAIRKQESVGRRTVELAWMRDVVAKLRKWHRDDGEAGPDDLEVATLERYRAELTAQLEGARHRHEQGLEMFRSVIEAGKSALNSLILINGGAAVALLAFAGHLVEQKPPAVPVAAIASSMATFVIGVASGSLGFGFRYIAQALFAHEHVRTGWGFNAASVLAAVASLVAFCWGGFLAYCAVVS